MPPIPKKKKLEPGFRKQSTFKPLAEQHAEARRIREAMEPVGVPATGAVKALSWVLDQGPKLVRRGEAAIAGLDQSAANTGDSLDQAVDEKVKAGGKGAYGVQRAMSASMLPPGATPESLGIPDDMLKQGPSSAAQLLDPVNLLPELGPAAKGALKMAAAAEKLGPVSKAAKWGLEYGPKASMDRVARVGGHTWKEKELLDARSSLDTWRELKPNQHEDLFRNTLDPATDNPARPHVPMSQLPPKERVAAQEMDDYFTRSGERNLKRGNIPQLEVNPTSGVHIRRPYGSENDALADLLAQLQTPPKQRGAPVPGVAKARTADIPLGSAHPKAIEADVSLGNIVGSHAEQLGKAEQGRLLVQQMQDFRGGNPLSDADWEWIGSKLGGGTLGKINRALDTAPGLGGSALRGVRDLNRTLSRGLSQNVLQRAPHYHINNMVDNPGQLALHGLNPASLPSGMMTMAKARKGDSEALRLIDEAQAAGVEVHSSPTRADLGANPRDTIEGLNREFGYPQTLGQKVKRVITGDALDDVLPTWLPFSRKFDSAMEGATRLGAYKSAVKQVGPGEKAGDLVADAMLDYGASNPLTAAIRSVFPITGFMLKGPAMVAKGVAKSPLRAKALMAGYEQLRGEAQPGNEVPTYWSDSSTPIKAPDAVKGAYGEARKALGGNILPAEDDLFLRGPNPAAGLELPANIGQFLQDLYNSRDERKVDPGEGSTQEVLNNAGQSLIGRTTPLAKGVYTAVTGKSARGGFPLPDIPHARALSTASELISPMIPSLAQAGINAATTKTLGLNTLGGIYEPREDEDRNPTDILVDRVMSGMGPSIQQITSEQAGKNQDQRDREAGISKKRRRY